MGFYVRLAFNIFKQGMTYRFEYITKFIGIIFSVVVQYYIWMVLLVYQETSSEIQFTEMATYITISVMMGTVMNNSVIDKINHQILTGEIASELIKPSRYFTLTLAKTIGEMLFQILFFMLPLGFLLYWGIGFDMPALADFVLFLCAFAGSFFLRFLICFCLGILGFWFSQTWILGRMLTDMIKLFSGNWIPLWFFPGFLRILAEQLPFQYLFFIPISIYMGRYGTTQSLLCVGKQLLWIMAFALLAFYLWKHAVKKLVIQGG